MTPYSSSRPVNAENKRAERRVYMTAEEIRLCSYEWDAPQVRHQIMCEIAAQLAEQNKRGQMFNDMALKLMDNLTRVLESTIKPIFP